MQYSRIKKRYNKSKMSTSSTRRKKIKQYGGNKIGQGITGTVYYPPLKCKEESKTPKGDYVSKKSKKEISKREFEKTEALRKLNLDNIIYPEHICEYDDKHNLLFSKYGGPSLLEYYDYMEKLAYSKKNINKNDFDKKYFNNVIDALNKLKASVKTMNENNIYQGDITFDNILYNEKENKAYLIDFEQSGKKRDEAKEVQEIIDILIEFKNMINLNR